MDHSIEKYKRWQPFLLGLSALIGLWAGLQMRQVNQFHSKNTDVKNYPIEHSQKIKDVLSIVQSKYLDSINHTLATDVALESFIMNLDPYSEYIPSNLIHKMADQVNGKSRGIGLKFIKLDTQFVVCQLKSKGPADLAGIEIGDYLLAIEDLALGSIHEYSLDSMVSFVNTNDKDSLNIQWKNRIDHQIQKRTIAVSEFDENAISCVFSPMKQVLYIKLDVLTKDSYRQFMKSLEKYFESSHYKDLIVDLRNNSGGLIHEAAFILNQLIEEKDVLMFKTMGSKVKDKEFRSTGKPFFKIEKILILINQQTASSAELMAAVLQDLDRAIIIGNPSFGKSTVIEQFSLGDGSAIRLAVSRYYTSSGRSIQKSYENDFGYSYLGNSNWKSDTSFYSRNKKKLAAHLGVVPDVLVLESEALSSSNEEVKNRCDVFISKMFIEIQSLLKNNPDNIFNEKKIESLIKQDYQQVMQEKKLSMNYEVFDKECRYAMARWFFGNEFEQRLRLINDEVMTTAINYLKSNK